VVRIIIADPSSPAVGGFETTGAAGRRRLAMLEIADGLARSRFCRTHRLVGYEVCEGLSTISAGTNACASFRTKLLLPALKVGSE
jgi:hypothetical protein